MDRYIGLDVSAQSCSLAVVGPSGKRLKLDVVETNAAALVERIKSIPGRKHLCLEEGTQSEWLHEVLSPHVDEIAVVVPGPHRGNKSDARDAWALAEALRRGAIDVCVFKAGAGPLGGLREAVRAHRFVTGDVVRVKNRLKAAFRARGLCETGDELYHPATRDRWVELLPESRRPLAILLGEELDCLAQRREAAEEWVDREAKKHGIVARLATAPGIGPLRAAQIVAIVVTPHRFRTKRQFWSYSGLAIVTRSSADWVRDGRQWMRRDDVAQTRGLNRNRQPLLKAVFKGAAHTVIGKLPEHPLFHAYQRMLDAGVKPNLAKVTLARRIAAAVLAMWKQQEDYDPAKHRRQITE